jgi:hypothetical protein
MWLFQLIKTKLSWIFCKTFPFLKDFKKDFYFAMAIHFDLTCERTLPSSSLKEDTEW